MTDDTVSYMGWGISAQEQIDGFRREVRELKAENALLWEQGALLFDKTLELGTENDRMRELVRQMHTCLTRPKAYAGTSQPYLIATECPYFTQGVCDYNSCGFERRMRELGIEVPDVGDA